MRYRYAKRLWLGFRWNWRWSAVRGDVAGVLECLLNVIANAAGVIFFPLVLVYRFFVEPFVTAFRGDARIWNRLELQLYGEATRKDQP